MTDQMSQLTEGHTVRAYDAELEQLRNTVLEMGGLVVDQITQAVNAVCGRHDGSPKLVTSREERVNRYDTLPLVINAFAQFRQPFARPCSGLHECNRRDEEFHDNSTAPSVHYFGES